MKPGTIDLEEVSTVLATQIIHAGHVTTFDTTHDPVTDRTPNPEVHKRMQKWLEGELGNLLKAA